MIKINKIWVQTVCVIMIIFLVCGFIFAWWMMPIVAFAYGIFRARSAVSARRLFAQVFAGVALLWLVTTLTLDARSGFHLSPRIGGLFKFGFVLGGVLMTAFVGGSLAALSALSGASLRVCAVRILNNRTESLRQKS